MSSHSVSTGAHNKARKTAFIRQMNTLKTKIAWSLLLVMAALTACTDDDSFTTDSSARLTFSADTIRMDTVFSTVPSAVQSFWAYNHSGDGLRCTSVRLENGNQVGFRVNVDGIYLSQTSGYQTSDIEVRRGDSIRVFVELTSPLSYTDGPKQIEDNLIFTLESGVQQRVNLSAFSWDADFLRSATFHADTTLSAAKPIVVYGGLTVAEGATLTLPAGTTLYFHSDAGLNVYGTLVCQGTADEPVVLRGDRLDHMFDYLPYDCVSGQWQGLHLYSTSYDNALDHTDLHGAFNGLVADSSDVSRLKLDLTNSTIHNCQGAGLKSTYSTLRIHNCQISNTLEACVDISGGIIDMNNCTLAQFYPFDSNRGAALNFTSVDYPVWSLVCANTLITGYADDEFFCQRAEGYEQYMNFDFSNCIIRTPQIETADSAYFHNVTFEDATDTTQVGKRHFALVDEDKLRYDFRLDSLSTAIDQADPQTATTTDHDGLLRDDRPDIGAYEWQKPVSTEPKQKPTRWKNFN